MANNPDADVTNICPELVAYVLDHALRLTEAERAKLVGMAAQGPRQAAWVLVYT